METKTIDLPDKMSELIRVALGDLRKAEKAPGVVVDMGHWHNMIDGKCRVCLAGAVMRRKFTDAEDAHPCDLGFETTDKLTALDWLRDGLVDRAAKCLEMPDWREMDVFNREVVLYADNKAAFYTDMEQLASDLEAAGY